MGKIIAIANQKGGVGKTTTALTLAEGLNQRGYKVLLIDLDGQGNLSYTAGAKTSGITSYDILQEPDSVKEAIQNTGTVDIIASSPQLANCDKKITGVGVEYKLKEALQPIKKNYDFIILDTPPALSILTVNALSSADSLIITAQADIYSLQGIGQLYNTISAIKKYTNKGLKVSGILITRYNGRAILSRDLGEMAEQTAEQLKTKVFKARIRESIAVKEAQAQGQSILTYSPKNNASQDYNNFIEELLKDM